MRPVPQPAKAICASRGIHNTDLAAAVGVSAHYLGRVLNGLVEPSESLKARIADELALPVNELFGASSDVLDLLRRTRTDRGMALVIDDPAVIARVAGIVAAGGGGDSDAA